MTDNIKWAWKILRSRAFIVLTEDAAICSIPLREPRSFESAIILGAQNTALIDFRDRLNDLIEEHEQASKMLARKSK